MKNILIKQAPYRGQDAKIFRAYALSENYGQKPKPLGIGASTTGNIEFGVLRCAAKAFLKYTDPSANPDEIETRILITENAPGLWLATLKS